MRDGSAMGIKPTSKLLKSFVSSVSGLSGGPIVNEGGKVIAVHKGTHRSMGKIYKVGRLITPDLVE